MTFGQVWRGRAAAARVASGGLLMVSFFCVLCFPLDFYRVPLSALFCLPYHINRACKLAHVPCPLYLFFLSGPQVVVYTSTVAVTLQECIAQARDCTCTRRASGVEIGLHRITGDLAITHSVCKCTWLYSYLPSSVKLFQFAYCLRGILF